MIRRALYLPLLVVLVGTGCVHPKPVLPTHGWVREEAHASARSLSGLVLDQQGGPREGVLVQLLTPDRKHRVADSRTDARGRFSFSSRANETYLLRFSLEGFNDVDLIVDTVASAQAPLKVALHISN